MGHYIDLFVRISAAITPVAVVGIGLIRYFLMCQRKIILEKLKTKRLAMREQSEHMKSHLKTFDASIKELRQRADAIEGTIRQLIGRLDDFSRKSGSLNGEMNSLMNVVGRLVGFYEEELKEARKLKEDHIPGMPLSSYKPKKKDK